MSEWPGPGISKQKKRSGAMEYLDSVDSRIYKLGVMSPTKSGGRRGGRGGSRSGGSSQSSGTFMSRNFAPRLPTRQEFQESVTLSGDGRPVEKDNWIGKGDKLRRSSGPVVPRKSLGPVQPKQVKDESWRESIMEVKSQFGKSSSSFYQDTTPSRYPFERKFQDTCPTTPRNSPLSLVSTNTLLTDKINKTSLKIPRVKRKLEIGDCNSNKESKYDDDERIRKKQLRDAIDPHLIGFQNLGNTCYMAAPLQVLLGLPNLVTDTLKVKVALDRIDNKTYPVITNFTNLVQSVMLGDEHQANKWLKELKVDLGNIDKQFSGDKMQDANEFLVMLIDGLRENLNKIGLGYENISGDVENIVDLNFKFEREETFVCCNCGATSDIGRHSEYNMFCDMSKEGDDDDDDDARSLQNLMTANMSQEIRERRCVECGNEEATVSNKLISLPRVLLVCLKRYKYSQEGDELELEGRKVRRPVNIPEIISVTEYVSQKVRLPNTMLDISTSQLSNLLATTTNTKSQVLPPPNRLPATPTKLLRSDTTNLSTPTKYKGKTNDEISKMSDEDQLEFMLFQSQRETPRSDLDLDMMTEDQQIQAALEASMNETPKSTYKYIDNNEYTENNNNSEAVVVGGPSEHQYRLSGVVSHYGSGTNSGHYVADVARLDMGGNWFNYDDMVVTQTDQEKVRMGSSKSNGYIFLFVHQPLWEHCLTK